MNSLKYKSVCLQVRRLAFSSLVAKDATRSGGLFFGDLKWNLVGQSCVNHTARSLWAVGVPTLPINVHPHILNFQLLVRQLGIYSSPYLYNIR